MKASQKRALGWVLVIPLSLLILILAFSLVNSILSLPQEEAVDSIMSYVITIGIMWFPLRYGYTLVKTAAPHPPTSIAPGISTSALKVAVKIELNAYYKLMLAISYRRAALQMVTFVAAAILVMLLFKAPEGGNRLVAYAFCTFILLMPLFIYFSAKKNYETNKQLQHLTHYTFSEEGIHTRSELNQSQTSWASIHKVEELKAWFILYIANQVGFVIPKNSFASAEELEVFRTLVANATKKAVV